MKTVVISEFKAKCIAILREAQESGEPIAEAYALPEGFHKDPADRILAATARLEHLTLLTADERLLASPHVATLDPRQ